MMVSTAPTCCSRFIPTIIQPMKKTISAAQTRYPSIVRLRNLRFIVSNLPRISSVLMRNPSMPCVCQSATTSSFFTVVSFAESASQNFLDAMDLRGDVAGGDAGDLRDARGVGALEVEQDDLPVERIQLLDEIAQPLHRLLMIERRLGIAARRKVVNVVETHRRPRAGAPVPDHVRRRNVVGNAIHPRPQRAIAGESLQAAPDGEMNVLEQIEPLVAIGFIRSRQPLQRRAVSASRFLVQNILRHQPQFPSERGSRRREAFLTA